MLKTCKKVLLESGLGADDINQYHSDFVKYKTFLKGINLGVNGEEAVQSTKAQLDRINMKLRQFWSLFERTCPNHPAHGPKPVAKTPDSPLKLHHFEKDDILTSIELKELKQQRSSMQFANGEFKDNLYNAVKKLESDSQYNEMLFQGLQPNLKKLDKMILKIDLKKDKNGNDTFIHRENSLEFTDEQSNDDSSPDKHYNRFAKTELVKVETDETPKNKLEQFHWPASSRMDHPSSRQLSENRNKNSDVDLIMRNRIDDNVRSSHGFVINSSKHNLIHQDLQDYEADEGYFEPRVSEILGQNQNDVRENDDNSLVFTDDNNPPHEVHDHNFDSNQVVGKTEPSFHSSKSIDSRNLRKITYANDEFIEIVNPPLSFGRDSNAVKVQGMFNGGARESVVRTSSPEPNDRGSVIRSSTMQNERGAPSIVESRRTFQQSIREARSPSPVTTQQELQPRVNMINYFPKHKEMRDKQLELKNLEEEEARLQAELNSLKAYQCKYKAPEKNENNGDGSDNQADKVRRFKQLLNKAEQESKRAHKNKIYLNKTHGVDIDDIPSDFLRSMITLSQERVITARENLAVMEQMIEDNNAVNEFTHLLDKLQIQMTHGQLANVDYSQNVMYYHKNLAFVKELHRLSLQNSNLKRLYNDIFKATGQK
jgi:hypothetical protein